MTTPRTLPLSNGSSSPGSGELHAELNGPQLHKLEELTASLFAGDAEQLRMFLRRQEGGAALVASLPEPGVGVAKLAHKALLQLSAEGRIGAGFFDDLVALAPRRAAEIGRVAHEILGAASTARMPVCSHVLVLQGHFLQQQTLVSADEVRAALAPEIPVGEIEFIRIDATRTSDPKVWGNTYSVLRGQVRRFIDERVHGSEHPQVSVFGLAPTPALVALGNILGDTIPTRLYGRLHDLAGWSWQATPEDRTAVVLASRLPKRRPAHIALLLSISAKIARSDVDKVLPRRGRGLIEIALESPRRDAVRTEAQLVELARAFRGVFTDLLDRYGHLPAIHLFPAAPAPVLVVLGQSLPRRVASAVYVHDFDRGFGPALEIIGN